MMSKYLYKILFSLIPFSMLIIVCLSCGNDTSNKSEQSTKKEVEVSEETLQKQNYKRNYAGIYVEDFPDSNQDPERYNNDNKIFKTARSFIYEYTYKDKNGEQFYFEVPNQENLKNWKLIPAEKASKNTIKQLRLVVQQGLEPFIFHDPKYNMSVLGFEFMMDNDFMEQKLMSQLVENEKNLWMTPPRDFLFKVLALSPYPFILYPAAERRPWSWQRSISDHWSDAKWIEWEGRLEASYKYAHHGHKMMRTAIGELRCYDIHAMASVGEKNQITKLNMIFNEEFGFITLDYLNVDSSTLFLELIEVQEVD